MPCITFTLTELKAIYATIGQILITGSNFAVFLLLAKLLSVTDYVHFSTAVGLNLLGYAIGDAGTAYVAPRELSQGSFSNRGALAASFISLTIVFYLLTVLIGFLVWNNFSKKADINLPLSVG